MRDVRVVGETRVYAVRVTPAECCPESALWPLPFSAVPRMRAAVPGLRAQSH